MTSQHSSNDDHQYLKFCPEKLGLINLFTLIFLRKNLVDFEFVECSDPTKHEFAHVRASWTIVLLLITQKALILFGGFWQLLGRVIEFTLNLYWNNGGLFGLLLHVVKGTIEIPKRSAASYRSINAYIDGRIDLSPQDNLSDADSSDYAWSVWPLDLYMMASKIAYENKNYIQNVVTGHWKMHFEEFFDCWNGTQAFILCDKAIDASVIVVAFRGTELFNAKDWSMNFDLSWISMGGMGKAHSGFMKALGMQDENFKKGWPKFKSDKNKSLAYYEIRDTLKTLIAQHKDAQIVITGHSLGGALASIFPSILIFHEETAILKRLRGIVTFGQPRVGDEAFASFMEKTLMNSITRGNCFRVVYRYDLVPRVPFDDTIFQFRHFGYCLYYRSWYDGEVMEEEPNKNYFDSKYLISKHANALVDLIRALKVGETQFREGNLSLLLRLAGLLFPGVASHSPRDYVNAARLGKIRLDQQKIKYINLIEKY